MMKLLRLIVPLLLVLTMLTGCTFYFNIPQQQEPEPAELPTVSEADPLVSAEDIYWRSKFAFSDRARAYHTAFTFDLTYYEDNDKIPADMLIDSYVELDPDASAVNVMTDYSYTFFGIEEQSSYQEYYRDEDGRLIYYFYDAQEDISSREEIDLDSSTPYAIILDYSVYGYPYQLPEDISMEPQTRILDGREVYVLTFRQSALDVFGYTGNSALDEQLSKRYIPTTWYVDAANYMSVQQEYSLSQIDDVISDALGRLYGLDPRTAQNVVITGFSFTINEMVFDPVDIADIPQDILQKAWQNSGFSAA